MRQITDTSGGNFRRVCGGMESGVACTTHTSMLSFGMKERVVVVNGSPLLPFSTLNCTVPATGQLNIRGLRLTRCSEINRAAIKRGNPDISPAAGAVEPVKSTPI